MKPVLHARELGVMRALLLGLLALGWSPIHAQLTTLEPIGSFELPYPCSQVIVLPEGREFVAIDYPGQRIVRIQLPGGQLVGSHAFTNRIARMTMTPDGSRLYVGLVTLPGYCNPAEDAAQEGAVAEIDLRAGGPPRVFPVAVDPFELVATDQRQVAIASCSGSAAGLALYDAARGVLLGRGPLSSRSLLVLHPDQRRVYASENPAGAFRLARLDLPVSEGPPVLAASLATSTQPQLWFLPGAPRMVAQDNRVYDLSPNAADDLKPAGRLPGEWCFGYVPWPELGVLYRLGESPAPNTLALDTFNLNWLHPVRHEFVRGSLAQAFATPAGLCLVHFGEPDRTRVEFYPTFGSNTPPVASFRISPEGGASTRTDVRLDAGASTDNLDAPGAGLSFRWDLDGDGTFETPFGTNAVRIARWNAPGRYNIGLEVKDESGATDRTQRTLDVIDGSDPGLPGEPHEPWFIDQTVLEGVFDEAGGWFYASGTRGDLLKLSLTNGLVARRWVFDLQRRPHALALMPAAQRLYVGLEVPGVDDGGFLAEFDLAAGVKVQEYAVKPFPAVLAASPDGWVAVHNGVARDPMLAMYRGAFGEQVALTPMRSPVRLAFHPAGRMLVVGGDGVDTLAVDPVSGHLGEMQPTGLGLAGTPVGRPVFLPGGTNVLMPTGNLYPCNATAIDVTSARWLELNQLRQAVALPDRGLLALVNESTILWLRHPELTRVVERVAPFVATAAGTFDGRLALASAETGRTQILLLNPPARSPDENRPPTAQWVQPTDASVVVAPAPIVFELRVGDDDGAVQSVTFLVDGQTWRYVEPSSPGQETFLAIWDNPGPGPHRIGARVMDNLGAVTEVPEVTVIYNQPPTVGFVTPREAELILTPTNLVLEVEASDADGRVGRVEFFQTGTGTMVLLGTVTNAPYRLTLTNYVGFDGGFLAQAVDDRGTIGAQVVRPVLRGPEGDDYRRPFLTAGRVFNFHSVNDTATIQTGEPLFRDPAVPGSVPRSLHHSQWWTWTAPSNGVATVSTLGSSFDTLLAVFLPPGTVVAANDDAPGAVPSSRLKFSAVQGLTYLLGVGGTQPNESGSILISLELTPSPDTGIPANDRFANRIALTGTTNAVARLTTIAAATAETSEPNHAGSVPRHSVWWSWRSPGRGRVAISTQGSDFDTVLGVYRGTVLASLVTVAANDDATPLVSTSRVEFEDTVAVGSTYAIAVDGFAGAVGSVVLTIQWQPAPETARPPNDDFTDAAPLRGLVLTASGNTTLATPEPGEPPHTPGADRAGSSVWWRWTAFGDGPVYLISTAAYAHGLAVYTGDRLDALEVRARGASGIVSAPSQRSVLSFMARAGTEYRIALEARAAPGPFELNLNASLPLEQPLLLWTDPLPGHELGLRVRVGRPSTVIVEESSDLQHWTARDPIFIENERVIAIPPNGVARFLRAFSP